MIKLHDELREYAYGPSSFSSSYAMKLVEGGAIGDIYGRAFERDADGNIVYETEGDYARPAPHRGRRQYRQGGQCESRVRAVVEQHLLLQGRVAVADAGTAVTGAGLAVADHGRYGLLRCLGRNGRRRDRGYVTLEGRRIDDVKGFYKLVGGRAGVTEYYMYDATNIRLRELAVSYALPQKLVRRTRVLSGVTLSLVARNLFFIYNAAPFDPDLILSTGNDNQGIEVYGMPTVRSVGFNIKLEF